MVPNKKALDLAAVFFYVSKQSGLIEELETINIYNDTTRIMFSDIHLGDSFDTALFTFKTPQDADVLLLNPNE